jgi:hypothetical protein
VGTPSSFNAVNNTADEFQKYFGKLTFTGPSYPCTGGYSWMENCSAMLESQTGV